MSAHHDNHIGQDDNHSVSTGNYIGGFVLAVILTLFSFIPVMYHMLDNWTLSGKILYLMGFGVLQIIVQIVYFLHLNHGPDAKWNVGTLLFAIGCVTIIVVGTWWAIQHLNYNMMGGSGRIIIPTLLEDNPSPAETITIPSHAQLEPDSEVILLEQKDVEKEKYIKHYTDENIGGSNDFNRSVLGVE